MIDRKKGNFPAIMIAILISAGGIIWQQQRIADGQLAKQAEMKAVPVEEFFEVKSVIVPNFIQGEDPLIIYNRQVKKVFFGLWNVEIHKTGEATDYAYCTGSGSNKYEPKEQLPEAGVKLTWFIGKDCHLPEGQYTLQTNWEIRAEGYPSKFESVSSNLFRVLPKGSQLFITPDQAKKLEELPVK